MNNLKTGTASEASEEHLIRKYLPSVNLLTKGSTLAEFTSGSEENSLIILTSLKHSFANQNFDPRQKKRRFT